MPVMTVIAAVPTAVIVARPPVVPVAIAIAGSIAAVLRQYVAQQAAGCRAAYCIQGVAAGNHGACCGAQSGAYHGVVGPAVIRRGTAGKYECQDRQSTRLNSSH